MTDRDTTAGVQYLRPEEMHRSSSYSQAVVVTGHVKTVYVGGQNAVDAGGAIVGKGDLKLQSEQVARNFRTVLAAAGAGPQHIVKWNVYLVAGQDARAAFEAFQAAWESIGDPPCITAAYVAGLAHPDFLLEVDAIAVVPE